MNNEEFHYHWWGKGDIDASLGVFFDGFSKVLTAVGILTGVFGLPLSVVLSKVVPGIGIAIFVGNLWYFHEAKRLAEKEKRQDVTSQPFGLGASQLSGWLYLIIGPVYWQTKDANLALQVGIASTFIGGFIEILGGFIGNWIVKNVPNSALLGNMASAALIWLTVSGVAMVFDKPIYGLIPLMIIIIDYLGKADKRFKKIPSGLIAIIIGTLIAWLGGFYSLDNFLVSFSDVGFYPPHLCLSDIIVGLKGMVPYLPVIVPLQINNFLSTLQGLESAKMAGDNYPQRSSMVFDGVSTLIGSLFGSPFPTTVYFGHPGWKQLEARAGFSLVNAFAYLIICCSGLMGILMKLIPTEVVMVLLIFVGLSVTESTFESIDSKYYSVILLSLLPIIFQYIQTILSSAIQAAGSEVANISIETFATYSVPIEGIQYLGNGAFLSSLLLAGLLADVIDKEYTKASLFALALAFCSAIGMIHCETVSLFSKVGTTFAIIYLISALLLFFKSKIKE